MNRMVRMEEKWMAPDFPIMSILFILSKVSSSLISVSPALSGKIFSGSDGFDG